MSVHFSNISYKTVIWSIFVTKCSLQKVYISHTYIYDYYIIYCINTKESMWLHAYNNYMASDATIAFMEKANDLGLFTDSYRVICSAVFTS